MRVSDRCVVGLHIDLCRIGIHVDRYVVAFHPGFDLHVAQNLHGKQPRFKLAILLAHKGAALPRHGKGLLRLNVSFDVECAAAPA